MGTLLSHTDIIYEDETIIASGQVFVNCTFTRCMIVITDANCLFQTSTFDGCVWQLHLTLHDGEGIDKLSALLPLISQSVPITADPFEKQT